jgi:hypothetical protein
MLPDFISGVIPIGQMVGDDPKDTELLRDHYDEARAFLLNQKWCFGLGSAYFGDGIGGVVAVFLIEIDPVPSGIDRWLWVIVGDIPSAYLVLDNCPTPSEALKCYLSLMHEWVSTAHENRRSTEIIPVNVPSTPENARKLEDRLHALTDFFVPRFVQREDSLKPI